MKSMSPGPDGAPRSVGRDDSGPATPPRDEAAHDVVARMVDVSFAYPRGEAILDRCSLTLRAGERVGLWGDNGSGKSTLLRLLVGLERPHAGAIEVLGRRCAREADFAAIRLRVGLLFQDSDDQLFCPTVADDVAFGLLNQRRPRAEVVRLVDETLTMLGLQGYEERITAMLSGGEKRLVALATVLAMQPDILLLDEPTTGLDETTKDRVVALLQEWPHAMLIVSHDRQALERVSERNIVLRNGKLDDGAA